MNLIRTAGKHIAARLESWREKRFDRRFGVDTRGLEENLAALGVSGEHLNEAYGYEPVQAPVFRAILRAASIEPREYAFVDFGSGKGRALLFAAEQGFRRVIGVELAPRLHEVAMRNAAAYAQRRPRAPRLELHCADAAELEMPAGDLFLSFYNPFGATILRKVAANIEAAYRSEPRRLVIAYRNPVHSEVLDSLLFLRTVVRNRTFCLYRNEPSSFAPPAPAMPGRPAAPVRDAMGLGASGPG